LFLQAIKGGMKKSDIELVKTMQLKWLYEMNKNPLGYMNSMQFVDFCLLIFRGEK
jgi:hypothetical protein